MPGTIKFYRLLLIRYIRCCHYGSTLCDIINNEIEVIDNANSSFERGIFVGIYDVLHIINV